MNKPTEPVGEASQVLADMRGWLELAVIGLNLCPFAKGVYAKAQVHFSVSMATASDELVADLRRELLELVSLAPEARDTTLLIAPDCLPEFLEFNDFMHRADQLLVELDLEGTLQIASFHPQFQFAGTSADDITNATNRAPYPTLHLLRESSIDMAVEAFPQAEQIYERNMETLRALGPQGWAALDVGPHTKAKS